MLTKLIQDQTACDEQHPESPRSLSSYGNEPSPKYKAKVAEKDIRERKAAGKSKQRGSISFSYVRGGYVKPSANSDTEKEPPLPEFPGIGRQLLIRYGKSAVYFEPTRRRWRVKPGYGSQFTHVVTWGRSRKDQIDQWEKVKMWLRTYNWVGVQPPCQDSFRPVLAGVREASCPPAIM